jgi:MerR family transcriptional regulator, aldehyde-responsive regulator
MPIWPFQSRVINPFLHNCVGQRPENQSVRLYAIADQSLSLTWSYSNLLGVTATGVMVMKIKEAAEQSGLSEDTIRFYEKSGMLPRTKRDKRGWRDFDPNALEWLKDLERLRSTGMPLKDVKRFAVLVHTKDANSPSAAGERLAILETHAKRLGQRRVALDECETFLTRKISVYRNMKGVSP